MTERSAGFLLSGLAPVADLDDGPYRTLTMRTFDIVDREGRLLAFEVSSTLVSRRGLVRLLSRIPGVQVVRRSHFLSPPEDEFCEFQCGASCFVVCEPFGDSSRYHVGPKAPGLVPETARIRAEFVKSNALAFLLF